MTIGERIKQRRLELKLSADEVAIRLGKNRATIYRYENSDIENLPTTVLEPLAKILETTPAHLMGWAEEQTKESSPKIMQYYKKLNDMGKHVATERVKELTEVPRYVKQDTYYVNAAHPIENATEEEKQHDEDIMDDENF